MLLNIEWFIINIAIRSTHKESFKNYVTESFNFLILTFFIEFARIAAYNQLNLCHVIFELPLLLFLIKLNVHIVLSNNPLISQCPEALCPLCLFKNPQQLKLTYRKFKIFKKPLKKRQKHHKKYQENKSPKSHRFLFGIKLGFCSTSLSSGLTSENWTFFFGVLFPFKSISDEKFTVLSCFLFLLLLPSFGLLKLWSLFNEANSMSLADEWALMLYAMSDEQLTYEN